MRTRAARSTKNGYLLRFIQQCRQGCNFFGRRAHGWRWWGKVQARALFNGIAQRHVARDGNYRNAAPRKCGLNGNLKDAGHLLGVGNELAIVAALREEMFRVGLLKISAPNLIAGNLRGDREHGNPAAVAVVQAVDQMQIARATTTRANG